MNGARRLVIGVAAAVVLAAAVLGLRELTESRHTPTDPDSQTLVELIVRTNREELGPTQRELVAAVATTCRIELGVEPVGPSAEPLGGDRFRTVFAPALDDTERLRYAGCLEDWRVDHLLIDVVTMRTMEATP